MPNNNYPHIQVLNELYQEETQAFRKVHRMIDLFKGCSVYLGVIKEKI